MSDSRFAPSILRRDNTAVMTEEGGEDRINRICQVVTGGKSGEGKKPSFLKVAAIDGKNNLPDKKADGEEIDLTEGLKGPYSKNDYLKIQFYRTKGTTDWKTRILERTENLEQMEEWKKHV